MELDDLTHQVDVLRWAKTELARIKEIQQAARDAIEARLGEQEKGTVDGVIVVAWPHIKRKSLNQQALRRNHPDIFDLCSDVTEVRRFVLIEDGHDDT